jgi:DNA-directed RNA polymerase subunit H
MAELNKVETLEEKRALLIIMYRNLDVESIEKEVNKIIYRLSKGNQKYIMHIHLNTSTIGIAYVRELKAQIDEEGFNGGIIVSDGKYTYSARSNAPEMNIELIPSSIPTFDVFQHQLIPLHEIVDEKGKEELKDKYHAEPYQFPWIKSTDPIAIMIGAKPGNVIRIIQKSETAGKYNTYRYVV